MNKNLLLMLLFLPLRIVAQNLVPNGDFEEKNGCPTSLGQYRLAESWNSTGFGTPDYFNDCSSALELGTEFNVKGGQLPHSGHGYMGFISENLHRNEYFEYLEATLKTPMIPGTQYCITLFVSHGTSSCALRELGVLFSRTPLQGLPSTRLHVPFTPVSNGKVLSESRDWTCITGTYTANGGETYMTLGDFSDDINFVKVQDDPVLDATFMSAYYFVDDISVISMETGECKCPEGK